MQGTRAWTPRHRRAALLPLAALAACVAVLIAAGAALVMHPATATPWTGAATASASLPLGDTHTAPAHAAAAHLVGPAAPSDALGDAGCGASCGAEHHDMMTACAMLVVAVTLAALMLPRRRETWLLATEIPPMRVPAPARRATAPDLRALGISRT